MYLSHVVGRCHVSKSNLQVIRYVLKSMGKKGRRAFRKLPKNTRHDLLRQAVQHHEENRELYRAVMSGRF